MVAVLSVAMYGYTHSIFGDRWDQPAMTVVRRRLANEPSSFNGHIYSKNIFLPLQPQMIQYWGYKVEEHRVTTSDGYILTMHRILGKKQRRNDIQVRRPVFLAHCLLCSSAVFSFGPPQQSLGFILADAGEYKKERRKNGALQFYFYFHRL